MPPGAPGRAGDEASRRTANAPHSALVLPMVTNPALEPKPGSCPKGLPARPFPCPPARWAPRGLASPECTVSTLNLLVFNLVGPQDLSPVVPRALRGRGQGQEQSGV